MPAVRIEEDAFSDLRYAELAQLCGLADADHARGKMALLWRQCTKENQRVLSVIAVTSVLGENGAAHIVTARLGERVDGGVRIRGTTGRIEWYEKVRNGAQKGGKSTKTQWRGKAPPQGPPQAQGLEGGLVESTADRKAPPQAQGRPRQEQEKESLDRAPSSGPASSELPSEPPCERRSRARARSPEPVPAGYAAAVEAYHVAYAAAYGGAKPTFAKRQGAIVKQRLAQGLDVFLERLNRLYGSPPSWLKPPFDLITLDSNWDRLVDVPADPKRGASGRFDPSMNSPSDDNDTPPWEIE